jgi:hypothetical protein
MILSSEGLGCPECSGSCLGATPDIIGKFVHSTLAVNVYKEPGSAVLTVRQPNTYVGKVEALNSKGNWIKLTDGTWIYYSNDLTFKTANAVAPLTDDQKTNILFDTASKVNPLASGATKVAYQVSEGVADTVSTVADAVGFIGKNLKWFVLGAAGLGALYVVTKTKKALAEPPPPALSAPPKVKAKKVKRVKSMRI